MESEIGNPIEYNPTLDPLNQDKMEEEHQEQQQPYYVDYPPPPRRISFRLFYGENHAASDTQIHLSVGQRFRCPHI